MNVVCKNMFMRLFRNRDTATGTFDRHVVWLKSTSASQWTRGNIKIESGRVLFVPDDPSSLPGTLGPIDLPVTTVQVRSGPLQVIRGTATLLAEGQTIILTFYDPKTRSSDLHADMLTGESGAWAANAISSTMVISSLKRELARARRNSA